MSFNVAVKDSNGGILIVYYQLEEFDWNRLLTKCILEQALLV